MKIHYLNPRADNITGGHFYNQKVLNYLSSHFGDKIIFHPILNKKYMGWRKIFAPFAELLILKSFSKGDIVFWGDTSYKYHFLSCIIASFFLDIKSVIIIHHFPFLANRGLKRFISYCIQRIYYSSVRYVIVPSPYTKSVAEKIIKSMKIVYIPLPFSREYHQSITYVPGNLLYVGTIEERKGIMYLLEAANILKSQKNLFHIDIVGKIVNQKYYNRLIEYVKSNNLTENISFRGRVSNEELETYYKAAELFVFPSLLEGYGIVLVEAMCKGLPIVAFDNSAMPYSIINGQNGFLARNADSEDFARKIMLILGKPEVRKKMQQSIVSIISTLNDEKDFYDSLADFVSNLKCQ